MIFSPFEQMLPVAGINAGPRERASIYETLLPSQVA
jgi:hypothetical protein